jgi:hypothetical protein
MTITNNNNEHNNIHCHLFFHLLLAKSGYAHGDILFGICYTFGGCILLIFCYEHYEKKRCFAIGLVIQFLSSIRHLQLIIFISCECSWTSYKSYKSCTSPYIWCNSLQLNYNFVTILFQLLCNSPMTIIIISCWRHFSSIHQNLTHGTMRTFCDFFEILISIVHYDYSFEMVLYYNMWHNKKLP